MAGGKNKIPRVFLSHVKLHVSRRRIPDYTVSGGVFHPPFPAMVDCKNPPFWYITAAVPLHMKVVEGKHDTGKYIVGGHCSVAAFIAELPDGTAVALRAQNSPFIFKRFRVIHR